MARYEVVSLKSRPDLRDRHIGLGSSAWPEFMLHDPVLDRHWGRLLNCFPDYQLALLDGDDLFAVMNTIPLRFTGALNTLPDRGVDWGAEKGVADYENGDAPNCVMGIQAVIGNDHRGKGLSVASVAEMVVLARNKGLERVILPVRPNEKHQFPLISMADYVAWKNEDGLPYDGWLRVHARLGGRVYGICPDSMIIPGTIAKWSEWTGLKFPGDGRYCVPGALVPIDVDVGRDQAVYREPNVWVVHEASGTSSGEPIGP
ncbi:MAG: hypothetical protein AAF414_05445 [Pseudomonadota bacterium]